MKFFIFKLFFAIVFVCLLILVIAFARGYRVNFSQKTFDSTGIIVASSFPDGAKVYVNGELKGATNTNITLAPGAYIIEVSKDGFTTWSKEITLKGELVVKADALLFPINPSLSPITSIGVSNAFVSPSQDKVIIASDSDEEERGGLFVLESSRNPLSRVDSLRLLVPKAAFPTETVFKNVTVEFSPDEKQLLVSVYADPPVENDTVNSKSSAKNSDIFTDANLSVIYLININDNQVDPFDVTESVEVIRNAWEKEALKIKNKTLETFKDPIFITGETAFDIIAFSPDEDKILYQASESAQLPLVINPPLISTNQTPEERDIKKGSIYVYDKEEDKNFRISLDAIQNEDGLFNPKTDMLWYPDSMHIVLKEDKRISVIDYDGSNNRTVYSGPFKQDFLAIAQDGQLFILTNFNIHTGELPDVYSVGIK